MWIQRGCLALTVAAVLIAVTTTSASAERRAEVVRDPNTGQLSATLDVQGGGQSTVSFEAQVTFDPKAKTVQECHLLEAIGHVSGEGCPEE
jgi:hypothetical protein